MAKAKPHVPNTPSESAASTSAPETTQEQAGAVQTQDEPVLSGVNGHDPIIGLRITSQREGFRRAGRAWGRAPIEIALADLSDDEIALLKAESMLTVEEITL
ncbi:MAG: HI1506-related protein [Betaproteobacteria bacterium]|nr:HI1506-related protein [Betaproteobacteria bacterium]